MPRGYKKFKSYILCSVCKEPLQSDLKNAMIFWDFDSFGKDASKPLIIAHQGSCDPGPSNYSFSSDIDRAMALFVHSKNAN